MSQEAELPYSKEGGADAEPVWARNQAELGAALGCDRRTVARYMKVDGNPGRTDDGRYNVTAWKLWADQHGHLRAAPGSKKENLELKALLLKNERAEMDLAVAKGELNSLDETCSVLSALFAGLAAKLTTLKHDLAPAVVGETVPEATKRLGAAFNDALNELSLADWAKKKRFWQSVSRRLSDLQAKFCPTTGPASM